MPWTTYLYTDCSRVSRQVVKAKVGKKYNSYPGSAGTAQALQLLNTKLPQHSRGTVRPSPWTVCVCCSVTKQGAHEGFPVVRETKPSSISTLSTPYPVGLPWKWLRPKPLKILSHGLSRSMSCSISLFMGFVCLPIAIRLPWLSHKTLSLWQKNKPVFIKISGSAFPRHQRDSHM